MPPAGQAVASKCPFLVAEMGQKNSSVVRQASLELQEDVQEMDALRKERPVTPPMVNVTKADGEDPNNLLKKLLQQRPTRVSHLLQENMPKSISNFHYDKFFEKKIEAKKNDHTYRVFKTVNRRATTFPMADDYTETLTTKRDVSVWCSNDYLGMSRHPRVIRTIMDTLRKHGSGAGARGTSPGPASFTWTWSTS
ncbi:hypothetical protein ANANG_G00248400 [Anguilla anguilla]|uniref:5-aminolevulinate synthase presequence domain-containing protein n=1 Tax=Anguilla anguilla TaxID=7936 RepID=A0A9D3LSX0_ANGAN|nr:hypothetical protein ANANG_G00248400 [Anguilla anguilla]